MLHTTNNNHLFLQQGRDYIPKTTHNVINWCITEEAWRAVQTSEKKKNEQTEKPLLTSKCHIIFHSLNI